MWCIGPHIRDWHANKHSKFKYLIRFFFSGSEDIERDGGRSNGGAESARK